MIKHSRIHFLKKGVREVWSVMQIQREKYYFTGKSGGKDGKGTEHLLSTHQVLFLSK